MARLARQMSARMADASLPFGVRYHAAVLAEHAVQLMNSYEELLAKLQNKKAKGEI